MTLKLVPKPTKKNRDGHMHLPQDFVPAKHNWNQEAYIRMLMIKVTNDVAQKARETNKNRSKMRLVKK